MTTKSIAFRAADSSCTARHAIFLERRWWRSVLSAAGLQREQPRGVPLCCLLEAPASIAATAEGELALEFGDPPLVVLSSGVELLPVLRADIPRLRHMRDVPMADPNRARLAHVHRAGLLLIDALEQLSTGLRETFRNVPSQYPQLHLTTSQTRVTR